MIDVQPFLDKLDRLKEYMEIRIDNQPHDMWMDMQVCPTEWYIKNHLHIPKPYPVTIRFAPTSFEEFLVNDYHKISWDKTPETLTHK